MVDAKKSIMAATIAIPAEESAIPAFALPGRAYVPLDITPNKMPSPPNRSARGGKQHMDTRERIPMEREAEAKPGLP